MKLDELQIRRAIAYYVYCSDRLKAPKSVRNIDPWDDEEIEDRIGLFVGPDNDLISAEVEPRVKKGG